MFSHAKQQAPVKRQSCSTGGERSGKALLGSYAVRYSKSNQSGSKDNASEQPEQGQEADSVTGATGSTTSATVNGVSLISATGGHSKLTIALSAPLTAATQTDQENVVPGTPPAPSHADAASPQHTDAVDMLAGCAGVRSMLPAPPTAPAPVLVKYNGSVAGTTAIRELVQATGNGITDALSTGLGTNTKGRASMKAVMTWRTRSYNRNMESEVTLKLKLKSYAVVAVQVTFTERATLPNVIRFMHSSGYSGQFRQLGHDVFLSADGEPRLKQTYLLGAAHTPVQQYLRMTLVGHLSLPAAGVHDVRTLEVIVPSPAPPLQTAAPGADTLQGALSPPGALSIRVLQGAPLVCRVTSPVLSPLQPILNERYTSPAAAKELPARPRYEQQQTSSLATDPSRNTDPNRREAREKGWKLQTRLVDTASSRAHAAAQLEAHQQMQKKQLQQQLYQPLLRVQSYPAPSVGPSRARMHPDTFSRSLMGLGSSAAAKQQHAVSGGGRSNTAAGSHCGADSSGGPRLGLGIGRLRSGSTLRKFMQLHTPIPEVSESNLATPLEEAVVGSTAATGKPRFLQPNDTSDPSVRRCQEADRQQRVYAKMSPLRPMPDLVGTCNSGEEPLSLLAPGTASKEIQFHDVNYDSHDDEVVRGSSSAPGDSDAGDDTVCLPSDDDSQPVRRHDVRTGPDVAAPAGDTGWAGLQDTDSEESSQPACAAAADDSNLGAAALCKVGSPRLARPEADELIVVRKYAISALDKMLGNTPNSQRIRSRLPSMSLPEAMQEYLQRTSSGATSVLGSTARGSIARVSGALGPLMSIARITDQVTSRSAGGDVANPGLGSAAAQPSASSFSGHSSHQRSPQALAVATTVSTASLTAPTCENVGECCDPLGLREHDGPGKLPLEGAPCLGALPSSSSSEPGAVPAPPPLPPPDPPPPPPPPPPGPPPPPPVLNFSRMPSAAPPPPPGPPPPPPSLTCDTALTYGYMQSMLTGASERPTPPPPPPGSPPQPVLKMHERKPSAPPPPPPPPPGPPPPPLLRSLASRATATQPPAASGHGATPPAPPPPPPGLLPPDVPLVGRTPAVAAPLAPSAPPLPGFRNAVVRPNAAGPVSGVLASDAAASRIPRISGCGGSSEPPQPLPSKPTSKLHWTKVPTHAAKNSVWSEMTPVKVEVDYAALENDFAVAQPVKSRAPGAAATKRQLPTVSITDPKRAQNIAIRLSKFRPLTPAQIVQKLVHITTRGESLMDEEQLEAVVEILPTEDERRRLAEYRGDRACLNEADKFLIELLPLAAELAPKMRLCIAMVSLPRRLETVSKDVALVSSACSEVRSSSLMKHLLKLALEIGNFLNASSPQGAAVGFHLDTLLRLRDVKSTNNKGQTLLHFVARQQLRQHPDESLLAQLRSCHPASKLNTGVVLEELRNMRSKLKELAKSLHDGGTDTTGHTTPFQATALTFLDETMRKIDEVEVEAKKADSAFLDTRAYLNGMNDKTDMARFFYVLSAFALDLAKAHAENSEFDARVARAKLVMDKTPKSADFGGSRNASRLTPASDPGPKARILNAVRAFSRLRPADRKALLTEKGARDHMREHNITVRQSIAHMPDLLPVTVASVATTPLAKAFAPHSSPTLDDSGGPAPAPTSSHSPCLADQSLAQGLQQFSREALLRISMPSDLFKAVKAHMRLPGAGLDPAARRVGRVGRSPSAGSGVQGATGIARIPEEGLPPIGDLGGASPLLQRHLPYPHHRPRVAILPKLDLSKLHPSTTQESGSSSRRLGLRPATTRHTSRIKTILTPRLRSTRTPRLPGGVGSGPGYASPAQLLSNRSCNVGGEVSTTAGSGACEEGNEAGGNLVESLTGGFISPGPDQELSDPGAGSDDFILLSDRSLLPPKEEVGKRSPSPQPPVRLLERLLHIAEDVSLNTSTLTRPCNAASLPREATALPAPYHHTNRPACIVEAAKLTAIFRTQDIEPKTKSAATDVDAPFVPHTSSFSVCATAVAEVAAAAAAARPGGYASMQMARMSLAQKQLAADAAAVVQRRRSSAGGTSAVVLAGPGTLPSPTGAKPDDARGAARMTIADKKQPGVDTTAGAGTTAAVAAAGSSSVVMHAATLTTLRSNVDLSTASRRWAQNEDSGDKASPVQSAHAAGIAEHRSRLFPEARGSGIRAAVAAPVVVAPAPQALISLGQRRTRSGDIFSIPMPSIVDRNEHPALFSAGKRHPMTDRSVMLPQGSWEVPPRPPYDPHHDASTSSSSNPTVTPITTPAKDLQGQGLAAGIGIGDEPTPRVALMAATAREASVAVASRYGSGPAPAPRSSPEGELQPSARTTEPATARELSTDSDDTVGLSHVRSNSYSRDSVEATAGLQHKAFGLRKARYSGCTAPSVDSGPRRSVSAPRRQMSNLYSASDSGNDPYLELHDVAAAAVHPLISARDHSSGGGYGLAAAMGARPWPLRDQLHHPPQRPLYLDLHGPRGLPTGAFFNHLQQQHEFMPLQAQLRSRGAAWVGDVGGGLEQRVLVALKGSQGSGSALMAARSASDGGASRPSGQQTPFLHVAENPGCVAEREGEGPMPGAEQCSGGHLAVGASGSSGGADVVSANLITPLREINAAAVGAVNAIGPLQRGLMRGPQGQSETSAQPPANFVGPLAYNLAARRARQVPSATINSSWGETPAPAPAWHTVNSAAWNNVTASNDLSDQTPIVSAQPPLPHPAQKACVPGELYRPMQLDVRKAWGSGLGPVDMQNAGATLDRDRDAHITYTVSATTPMGNVVKPAPRRRPPVAQEELPSPAAANIASGDLREGQRCATADGALGASVASLTSSSGAGLSNSGWELGTGEQGMQPYEPV